jgi:phosphoribosylaminoimidazole carboxylase PurE protein
MSTPAVGVIMGSDSDLKVMGDAARILEEFAVPFEMTIVSAHRTPQRMVDYATDAAERGLSVIIAGAGGAAHLPGMVAALTPLPVIGVPIAATLLNGNDALLSIVQMPAGVPVATVAINNATNAALLAVQILGTRDPALRAAMVRYKLGLSQKVLDAAERTQRVYAPDAAPGPASG